jgi:hypothetical protein
MPAPELLADRGKQVELITSGASIGSTIASTDTSAV